MYKGSRELDRISPQQLDNYLSRGWFRMNQSIFTTPFLQEGFDFRDAIWLRHHLRQFEYPKRFLKLQQNNFFEIDIKDLSITPQHELLYQKYRESRPIEAPLSLENIIYGDGFNNIYHTKIINLYINDELVGSGILDLGEKAAAGIVNFYDPVYAKYSPGKFLFLLAVQYCQHEGLDFFYPGYFVPGNPHFDYKLDISKPSLNYFDVSSDSWLPIASFREIELPTRLIRVNLMNLNGQLEHIEIPSCFIHNANYFFLKNSTWDSPFATYVLPTGDHPWQFAITFNTNNNHYYIFDCTDMDCAAEIFEEDGRLVCFQFLNLKHPIAECYSINDTVQKLQKLQNPSARVN